MKCVQMTQTARPSHPLLFHLWSISSWLVKARQCRYIRNHRLHRLHPFHRYINPRHHIHIDQQNYLDRLWIVGEDFSWGVWSSHCHFQSKVWAVSHKMSVAYPQITAVCTAHWIIHWMTNYEREEWCELTAGKNFLEEVRLWRKNCTGVHKGSLIITSVCLHWYALHFFDHMHCIAII